MNVKRSDFYLVAMLGFCLALGTLDWTGPGGVWAVSVALGAVLVCGFYTWRAETAEQRHEEEDE
jgi:Flp pilus assembly protein TadB